MNWYLITYDIVTSNPGDIRTSAREERQILSYLQGLALSFANSKSVIILDESDLIAIGLAKIRDKIDKFEVRSDNDDAVTRSFKVWMSKTCLRRWSDEYNKQKRKLDYETKHYSPGETNDQEYTIEPTNPLDMDSLVINAEDRYLMRDTLRNVLDTYPEHRVDAILQYRSTRKGRNGARGFEGETAEIAANANVSQSTIRKWSERFEDACINMYEQEKRNVKNNQAASSKTSR